MIFRAVLSVLGNLSLAVLAIVALAVFFPGLVVLLAAGSANKKETLDEAQRFGAVLLSLLAVAGWWWGLWLGISVLAAG